MLTIILAAAATALSLWTIEPVSAGRLIALPPAAEQTPDVLGQPSEANLTIQCSFEGRPSDVIGAKWAVDGNPPKPVRSSRL